MRINKNLRLARQRKKKTLYVRLPHRIREEGDVSKLFTGDFKVRLVRQSSRYCYVIFHDIEEMTKNLEAARNLKVNKKPVVVAPAITKVQTEAKKLMKKKVVIPAVKADAKVTKTLFVSHIKCGTKLDELKCAIPGFLSIKMLKPYSPTSRSAIVKMESAQIAAEYLSKVREWPVLHGYRLRFNPDSRKRHRSDKPRTLKIYDGEPETKPKPDGKSRNKVLKNTALENKE